MSEFLVKTEGLSKAFYRDQNNGFSIGLGGLLNSGKKEMFWALENITFELCRGDRVGLIGKNGAGKTTLLKLITGITWPTHGYVHRRGRISSVLGPAAGFQPDLSGVDNIYFSAAIMGFSKRETATFFKDIVEFSELAPFIHTPVKHYSQGMRARLGISISLAMIPEILIFDEVLSVADLAFQKKAIAKIKEVAKAGQGLIYVTHDMDELREVCNKALYLKDSTARYFGSIQEAIHLYLTETA